MTNIIDARYPIGKVESMNSNFRKVVESLPLLTTDDLDDLKDAIMDEMKARENKKVIELKEKAIKALREFFNAGGYVLNNEDNYNWGLDEALTYSGEDDYCIFLR